MAFDFFAGDLLCPRCGKVAAGSSSNIQTKIRTDAAVEELRAGARVDASPENLRESDYLEYRSPAGAEVGLIEGWWCPACRGKNWALISIRDGVIREVSAAADVRKALAAANYVSDEEHAALFEDLTGSSAEGRGRKDLLDALARAGQK